MTSVIVAGARNPIGKLLGELASSRAVDLGAHAISAAVAKAGISSAELEGVYFGNGAQAGVRFNLALLAAVSCTSL